jgi:hypothetical protein
LVAYHLGVHAALHLVFNIKRPGQVAADVHPGLLVIDPDVGFVVYCLEMEQKPPGGLGGQSEGAVVPERLARFEESPDARERGFEGEGHQDLSSPRAGLFRALVGHRVIPEAVEIGPAGPLHLGAGIFLPGGVDG